MSILTVGSSSQYKTISAAITASKIGDTINVVAGTYTNDFLGVYHSLNFVAVGGVVNLVATVQPPNGKALIDEGGTGVSVSISGFDISGVTVGDGNGAAIRYEGGTLLLDHVIIHNNQDGLLANSDANGSITISASTFYANGAGDGYTHNIYVNNIASLTVKDSIITGVLAGHDIKSRAAATTITGNVISDGLAGTGSYEIDLPNGGVAVIENNYIEKGANAQNPIAVSYGEEGNLKPASSLKIAGNVFVNNSGSPSSTVMRNASGTTADMSNNSLFGWKAVSIGQVNVSENKTLATKPTSEAPPGALAPTLPDKFVLNVSEDAWNGDAQFMISVDGVDLGQTYTATASHAAGASQQITIAGAWGANAKTISASFINDAYGGSVATDRNLYVNSVNYNGHDIANSSAVYLWNETKNFNLAPPTATDMLVLTVSEDAWQGDAQFKVSVDGVDVGQTFMATASHVAGATQKISIAGNWGANAHNVSASFVNDAYGGSAATDRNLYIHGVRYDGHDIADSSATFFSEDTRTFTLTAPAPTFILLHLTEDAYLGDAQYSVAVDGRQAAPDGTVMALNGSGNTLDVSIASALASGWHDLSLSFLNDAYGGSPSTDRNLYSKGVEVNATPVAGGDFTILANGAHHVAFLVP